MKRHLLKRDQYVTLNESATVFGAGGNTEPFLKLGTVPVIYPDGSRKDIKTEDIVYVVNTAMFRIKRDYRFFQRFINRSKVYYIPPGTAMGNTMCVNQNNDLFICYPFVVINCGMKVDTIFGIIFHELMHNLLRHIQRTIDKYGVGVFADRRKALETNIATDLEVNGSLVRDGIVPKNFWKEFGGCYDEDLIGIRWEDIMDNHHDVIDSILGKMEPPDEDALRDMLDKLMKDEEDRDGKGMSGDGDGGGADDEQPIDFNKLEDMEYDLEDLAKSDPTPENVAAYDKFKKYREVLNRMREEAKDRGISLNESFIFEGKVINVDTVDIGGLSSDDLKGGAHGLANRMQDMYNKIMGKDSGSGSGGSGGSGSGSSGKGGSGSGGGKTSTGSGIKIGDTEDLKKDAESEGSDSGSGSESGESGSGKEGGESGSGSGSSSDSGKDSGSGSSDAKDMDTMSKLLGSLPGAIYRPSADDLRDAMDKMGMDKSDIDSSMKGFDSDGGLSDKDIHKAEAEAREDGHTSIADTLKRVRLDEDLNDDAYEELLRLFADKRSHHTARVGATHSETSWGNKNHLWRGAIMPRDVDEEGGEVQTINVFLDWSGSVENDLVVTFVEQVIAICKRFEYSAVRVYGFGNHLSKPYTVTYSDTIDDNYEKDELIRICSDVGGGSYENFNEVADKMFEISHEEDDSIFVVFGDGIWLETGKGFPKNVATRMQGELSDILFVVYEHKGDYWSKFTKECVFEMKNKYNFPNVITTKVD